MNFVDDFCQDLMIESMEIKASSGWLIYQPVGVDGLIVLILVQ